MRSRWVRRESVNSVAGLSHTLRRQTIPAPFVALFTVLPNISFEHHVQ